MNNIKYLLILSIFTVSLFAKQESFTVKEEVVINSTNSERPIIIQNNSSDILPQNREEIDLWVDDFEEDLGWSLSSGWEWSEADYNSATHSMHSGGTASNASFDLVSPEISLPALGEGETMAFGFYLFADMPDSDGDGDGYLEDYYTVSIQDTDALAWHPSSTDSFDGNSWWCADETVGSTGGYLDSWIQFMDTPSFTVPANASMSADMMWTIEDYAGAVVAGTCTDGWDAANVQISIDGGESWELLSSTAYPYDFDCGYGWIWNSPDYDTGGSLNHLAAGWGGNSGGWNNLSFDLSQYVGQEATIRFAFGSDPAYCTLDDGTITGFHVDNVMVSGALDCNPENGCETTVSGAVWVDQFYDYGACDEATGDIRPGACGWEEYLPGYPFNGNVFLDISDFAEKNVVFRVQSRFDDNDDVPGGTGLWIDDFRVYKISGGNYPAPWDLAGEGLGGEAALTWADMNASGNAEINYVNNELFNGIQMSTEGSTAYAGTEINLAGASNVSLVSVYNVGAAGSTTTIAGFGQLGTLYSNEPTYSMEVTLDLVGWNDFVVDWDFTNSYIIGHEFGFVDDAGVGTLAALDESAVPSQASKVLFSGGSWDDWSVAGAAVGDGEWGIKASVAFEGANVTYNVYRDGAPVASGLVDNSYTDTGLTNNTTYLYAVSATYSDGEESGLSESVEVTPQAQTVHEEYHDDGTAETGFNAGSGNFTAVKYSADNAGESVVRFKWYQMEDGGAFYLKMYEDVNGMPGAEFYSTVVAGGVVTGWNTKDLSEQNINVSGDFWIGTKEFSSTSPFGLDTDSADMGMSYTRVGTTGDWTAIAGNLMERIYLDCGENCDDGGSCTAGDVNGDGVINVLDIVSTVSFVMNTQSPTGDEECAADFNGDGIINVLDIVSIVGVITGG